MYKICFRIITSVFNNNIFLTSYWNIYFIKNKFQQNYEILNVYIIFIFIIINCQVLFV